MKDIDDSISEIEAIRMYREAVVMAEPRDSLDLHSFLAVLGKYGILDWKLDTDTPKIPESDPGKDFDQLTFYPPPPKKII